MAGSGEDAHVRTDLGDDGRRRHLLDAGYAGQAFDGGAKGRDLRLDALIELGDLGLDLIEQPQMPADEIAMVLAHPARERLDQRTAPTFQRRAAQSAILPASVSPAAIAASMRRPLTPIASLRTDESLMLASCRIFSMRYW